MAMVDFSNARIEPRSNATVNNTSVANVALEAYSGNLYNAAGSAVVGTGTVTQLINQQKQLMYLYQGTFSASGTEFYFSPQTYAPTILGWKISNISFQSGDTYVFQINANLVCN